MYYLVVTDIPTYFNQVLNMQLDENGLLSGLPCLAAFFTQLVSGLAADFLISKGYSVTVTRRLMAAVSLYPTAVFLFLVGYVGCDDTSLSVTYIVLILGIANLSYSSYGINPLDISPRFAGLIWSISAWFSNIPGAVTPLLTGYIVNEHPTRHYYRIVFDIAAGICAFTATFYCVFSSGEEQDWDRVDGDENDALLKTGYDEELT